MVEGKGGSVDGHTVPGGGAGDNGERVERCVAERRVWFDFRGWQDYIWLGEYEKRRSERSGWICGVIQARQVFRTFGIPLLQEK